MSRFVDKLNPTVDEIVNVWTGELDSGRFKQGRGCLQNGDEYCCLGVLTRIYQEEIGDLKEKDEGGKTAFIDSNESYNCNVLPERVARWAKMKNAGGAMNKNDGFHTLSLWEENDVRKKSFPEIAKIIRSDREFLFEKE